MLLQSSWPVLHPLVMLLGGTVLTALATWLWKLRDERRAARLKAEEAETAWRKARLDSEAQLSERITNLFQQQSEALKTETQARLHWQLENDADIARIVDIFKDVNEGQKLLAKLAADSQHHASDLKRLNDRVEDVGRQLTQFVMDHAKHT